MEVYTETNVAAQVGSTPLATAPTRTSGGWMEDRTPAAALDLVRHERMRISHQLHDRLGYYLSSISMGLAALDAVDAALIKRIRADLNHVVEAMHEVVEDLRNEPACLETLTAIAEEWARAECGKRLHFEASADLAGRLTPARAEFLADALREALTNVSKHAAQAREVRVYLMGIGSDGIGMIVTDDGPGLASGWSRGGFGLRGIAERSGPSGSLRVERRTDAPGTRFILAIGGFHGDSGH